MTQNEMVKYWLDALLENTGKTDLSEITEKEIREEIDNTKCDIRNEHLWVLGSPNGYHEENINNLEEYLEVLYSLLVEKEVKHEALD